MTDVDLNRAGTRWARAAAAEKKARADRDAAILAAHQDGKGIREIARAIGIDPTQVMRVVRRAEEAATIDDTAYLRREREAEEAS